MGTLQWHHVHSSKVGRHAVTIVYNGTLQWHHVHPQSWPSPSPPHHSTLQWHPAMAPPQSSPPTIAHYNGTQQWHHPKVPPQPYHTTMAPSNGTTSTAPCNGTLVQRPISQSGSFCSPDSDSYRGSYFQYGERATNHFCALDVAPECHCRVQWT